MTVMIQHIITDIEGTTTPITFVHDVLFPFVRKHLTLWLSRNLQRAQELYSLKTLEEIQEKVIEQMDKDLKCSELKTLQGWIWKEAYEKGELQSIVYPDVPEAFKKWSKDFKISVYSSGSVDAQKLLFRYSDQGDLTAYFTKYYDTVNAGSKLEAKSYEWIAKDLELNPENILFLTDNPKEVASAQSVGFKTVLIQRPLDLFTRLELRLTSTQAKDATLVSIVKALLSNQNNPCSAKEIHKKIENPPLLAKLVQKLTTLDLFEELKQASYSEPLYYLKDIPMGTDHEPIIIQLPNRNQNLPPPLPDSLLSLHSSTSASSDAESSEKSYLDPLDASLQSVLLRTRSTDSHKNSDVLDPGDVSVDELDSLLGDEPRRLTRKRRRGNTLSIQKKSPKQDLLPITPRTTEKSVAFASLAPSPLAVPVKRAKVSELSYHPDDDFLIYDDSMDADVITKHEKVVHPWSKSLDPSHLHLISPRKLCGYLSVWTTTFSGIRVYISWLDSRGLCMGSKEAFPLLRRMDNDMVNATLLLHAAGVYSEQEKSVILSLERNRVRCSDRSSPLFGVWIPCSRALALATSCCIETKVRPFLAHDLIKSFTDPPTPQASSSSLNGSAQALPKTPPLNGNKTQSAISAMVSMLNQTGLLSNGRLTTSNIATLAQALAQKSNASNSSGSGSSTTTASSILAVLSHLLRSGASSQKSNESKPSLSSSPMTTRSSIENLKASASADTPEDEIKKPKNRKIIIAESSSDSESN